jgi:hypothetical protein
MLGVSEIIFARIQDSFTTQEIACCGRVSSTSGRPLAQLSLVIGVRGVLKITITFQRVHFARTFQ